MQIEVDEQQQTSQARQNGQNLLQLKLEKLAKGEPIEAQSPPQNPGIGEQSEPTEILPTHHAFGACEDH